MPVQRPLTSEQQAVAGITAHWERFGYYLQDISRRLHATGDFVSFAIRGLSGQSYGLVGAADVRRKFDNISWQLTGDAYQNGGVGQIVSKFTDRAGKTGWISATQETNLANFAAYAVQTYETGLIYLALHETAHVTEPGIRTWDDCWQKHKENHGTAQDYPNTDLWNYNEQFANCVVIGLCDGLGLSRPTFAVNPGYLP